MRLLRYLYDLTIDRLFHNGQFHEIIREAYHGDLRFS